MQITADVFGLPVSRPHLYEASGLGAAVNAAVGAGIHTDYSTAIKEMTRLGDTFEPDMAVHDIYRSLYEDVYLRMYKQLQPLYRSIQALTLPESDEKISII